MEIQDSRELEAQQLKIKQPEVQNREEQKKEELSDMEKLLRNAEKQLFYARVRSGCVLIFVAAVVVSLILVVPKIQITIQNANDIMAQASETLTLADEAIGDITDMSTSISTMGENLDTFITDNSETVATVMEELEGIDFEGLNAAIEDLGEVVEPLAKFFGVFH